ncbi:hypothetical protein L1049_009589 [Liquidambar formosana]|uniref:Protein SMG7L-like n=1 Tax=Liquidambar formosana TaxID=63359 RepID=A0AAP0N9U3_LIQFO
MSNPIMNNDSPVPLNDQKETKNFFAEVVNVEKQLWALIHSKGLLHTETQELYRKAYSSYEKIILNEHKLAELQSAEYSLWKLHYKHIDEFRRQIGQNSANAESTKSAMSQNVANVQNSNGSHIEGFKSFLSEATEFYKDLIMKVRRCYGFSGKPFFYKKGSVSCSVEPTKLHDCQFLCHRFLVCLGDLARYRELYGKLDNENHNWSIAATYYLEATMVWPDGGNPQNQLAVLATYIGDEFLALYHCIRSLAVKQPFPDAWDNLMVLFEKNRSSCLQSVSSEAHFDFLNPSQRSVVQNKLQSSDGFSNCKTLKSSEYPCSWETDLCSLIVRTMSFFFVKSSMEGFPCTFASTMGELEALMELDDMKLKAALESYQRMDSARTGPFKALQIVSIVIFIIHNLTKSAELQELKAENDMQKPVLTQLALTATFICMGRFVDRCLKFNPMDSCPLLPAVLVFVEWLVGGLDIAETYGADEKSMGAMSYFFSAFVDLLNRFNDNSGEVKFPDHTALWEDCELLGFAPIADSHMSLDFSTHSEHLSFEDRKECRAHRIIDAAMKIVHRSNHSRKWIFCDKSGGNFYMSESKEFPVHRVAEVMESSSDLDVEPHLHICEASKEYEKQIHEENQSTPHIHGKSVAIEEEEVILFKPITRYNSAPLSITTNDKLSLEGIENESEPPDECLRRASSVLIAQNQAPSNPFTFRSNISNFRCNNPFKQQEALSKESVAHQFYESPLSAGPPSLSGWVLNKGSLSIEREKGASGKGNHRSGPVEDIASASLTGLSISETEDSVIGSKYISATTHYASPYSAPVPSAPLLPEDAVWFGGVPSTFLESKSSGGINETGHFLGASPASGYSNWAATHRPLNFGPSIPGFMDGYPPLHGMTNSSEWLHQYNDNRNLELANSHTWPVHLNAPANLGNFHGHNASRFDLFDRWGNPMASNPMVYLESPPLHPGFAVPYGVDEQRREKLFHNFQRPSPYGCGAVRVEQQPLLQYLKEKEWGLQQDPQVRGPTYMGN